jgi:hypothetical protein
MAKIDLKFLDTEDSYRTLQVDTYKDLEIRIAIDYGEGFETIYLDKSTAIKFAKTLRTEINKIQS